MPRAPQSCEFTWGLGPKINLVVNLAHADAHAHSMSFALTPHACAGARTDAVALRWPNVAPRRCQNSYAFSGVKSRSFWCDLALSNQEPGSSKIPPGDANMGVNGSKMAQSWPPGEPKMPPRIWHMFVKIMCPILRTSVP